MALTSPTSGGRSVGIVRSLIKDKEFSICSVDRRVEKKAQQLTFIKDEMSWACSSNGRGEGSKHNFGTYTRNKDSTRKT
jgi:hypothetical protein